jgi:hypothetical protein
VLGVLGVLGGEQQLSCLFHEWPSWQVGGGLLGGGGAVGRQQEFSVRQDKVSPGEARSARERTLGPEPVVRRGAAFPGTIQGMKGQGGHSVGKRLTYGGLGGLVGGLVGAQQPFWSYQNSLG